MAASDSASCRPTEADFVAALGRLASNCASTHSAKAVSCAKRLSSSNASRRPCFAFASISARKSCFSVKGRFPIFESLFRASMRVSRRGRSARSSGGRVIMIPRLLFFASPTFSSAMKSVHTFSLSRCISDAMCKAFGSKSAVRSEAVMLFASQFALALTSALSSWCGLSSSGRGTSLLAPNMPHSGTLNRAGDGVGATWTSLPRGCISISP
mmetsp:Transcript_2484/g.6204  ORF Transcript_2484/g.6204 Transcript_2484/m.6204 type:complete len:212 (-) Transcript_2484:1794-2429(-)